MAKFIFPGGNRFPFAGKIGDFFAAGRRLEDRQANLDKKLVYSLSKSRIPKLAQIKYLKKFLDKGELRLMRVSFMVILSSLVFMAVRFYVVHLEIAPVSGGEYSEALVGSPKRINHLYAGFSDVDSDIARLVFSSLLKYDGDGKLADDLAESREISADGKIYTFKIRKDVKWHNGSDLTVDDILFTFHVIKDGQYKAPLKASFEGVEAEKVDDATVRFLLAESYAPFPELLTFGIIPQDLWYQVPPQGAGLAELNLKPVGSGPYKFKSLVKDKMGQIKEYSLAANKDYYGGRPNLDIITFKFFPSAEEAVQAMNDNSVDGVGYLPKRAEDLLVARNSYQFYSLSLPELTAVFFNQKNNRALSDVKVRQALALAIDKDELIKNVLGGDASAINGPILPDSFAYNPDIKTYRFNKEAAAGLLDEAGWKPAGVTIGDINAIEQARETGKLKEEDESKLAVGAGNWRFKDKFLTVKLTVVDMENNINVAQAVKRYWEDIGVKTSIEAVPAAQIQGSVIRPRNFEALFYGQVVGGDPDVYAFWHSSQVGESGANISEYADKEADQLLEDGRLTIDSGVRKEKYGRFQQIIADELPAVFMYSPVYKYAQKKKVRGLQTKTIQSPDGRFADISGWYMKTAKRIIW